MRTYPNVFDMLMRDIRSSVAIATAKAQVKLKQRWREAHWRLNESEATVHARFFNDRWQHLLANYGERRNGEMAATGLYYYPSADPVHQGDKTRYA